MLTESTCKKSWANLSLCVGNTTETQVFKQLIKEYFELLEERNTQYNDLIQQNNELKNALDKACEYLHKQDIRINTFDPAHEIDTVEDWKEWCMKNVDQRRISD